MKPKLGLGGVVVVVSLLAAAARAEVRDDGNFFSPDAVQKANGAIDQMRRDVGKEMLIETYPAIPSERASEYHPENKDEFFRKWGNERATAAHVNGVYILINKNPSYLFITAGNKTRERDFTTSDEKQLRDEMLALLKQKQYDAALAKAVELVPQQIREHRQQTGSATANPAPPPPPDGSNVPPTANAPNVPAPARGFGFGAIIVLLVILGIGWMILRALFGRRSAGPGQPGYGGYGNYGGSVGGGGGFGRGLLGGILGGMAGGWLQNRMSHRDSGSSGGPPMDPGGSGTFSESSGDSSFSGGAGGNFDSGGSSGGDSSSDGGSGGAF
jgi:hypothetical protein